jgi:hypothetical protein
LYKQITYFRNQNLVTNLITEAFVNLFNSAKDSVVQSQDEFQDIISIPLKTEFHIFFILQGSCATFAIVYSYLFYLLVGLPLFWSGGRSARLYAPERN